MNSDQAEPMGGRIGDVTRCMRRYTVTRTVRYTADGRHDRWPGPHGFF